MIAISHPFSSILKSMFNDQGVGWPLGFSVKEEDDFIELTSYHGIQPLLFHLSKNLETTRRLPARILERFHSELADQSAAEMLQHRELIVLFRVLAEAHVFPLLMKGVPLSYTHYPFPALRPHLDVDMFLPPADRNRFIDVVESLGYRRGYGISGELITFQETYKKEFPGGIVFVIDCHRRISNPPAFSHVLTFEELREKRVAVPSLGPHAFTLCPQHALLLACLHRIAHHRDDSDRLIWLYDIHLIVEKMSEEEFSEFTEMAVEKHLRSVCDAGLKETKKWFGTNFCENRIAGWNTHPDEATAAYLNPGLRRVDRLQLDLAGLRGKEKIKLLKEHLFPSQAYMMEKYAVSSRLVLPALYLHRAIKGTLKFLRRPD